MRQENMAYYRLNDWDESGFDYGRPKLFVFFWFIVQDTIFRFSPVVSNGFRRWLLRLFGCKVGKGVVVRPRARLHYPWRIEIGDYSSIGDDVWLYSIGPIKIGHHTIISQKSFLCTASHDYQDPHFKTTVNPINIGSGVWIAADVFVGPGVTIGENAVVGARSSVFDDVPPGSIGFGNPYKVMQIRNTTPERPRDGFNNKKIKI